MLKLLIITRESFLPIGGASTIRINSVAKKFKPENISFIAPKNQDPKLVEKEYPGSNLYLARVAIPKFGVKRFLSVLYFGFMATKLVKKTVEKHKPDVIYAHGTSSMIACSLSRIKVPIIADLFEVDLLDLRVEHKNYLFSTAGKVIQKFFDQYLKNAKKIIVLTKEMKIRLQEKFPTMSIIVAYDSMDTKRFLPRRLKKGNNPTLVYVGDIDERDGLNVLIEALPRIIKEVPNTKMVIAGDGKAYPDILKRIEDLNLNSYIECKGWVSFDEVINILKNATVGMAPARQIPFNDTVIPRKVFEYLAVGLPVIATDGNAIREIIKDGENGYLTNDRVEDVAEKTIEILTSKSKYEKMQKNARRTAIEFDLSKQTEIIVSEIEDMDKTCKRN